MLWSWRSHSPPWSQMGQSRGWLTRRNSITPSLAQTHPAVTSDGESVVITEPGNLHPDQSSGLENCGPRVNKDLLTIDETFKLLSSSRHGPRSIFYKWGLDQILYL